MEAIARSLDVAQVASTDLVALNNTVVNMRSSVKSAKVQVIHKLTRSIRKLKTKKGSDEEKKKNLQKAERMREEIFAIKALKADKVSKFALANKLSFEEICKQPTASTELKCLARLAHHKQLSKKVSDFRVQHHDWPALAAYLMVKQTGRRFRSKKQKEAGKKTSHANITAARSVTHSYLTNKLGASEKIDKLLAGPRPGKAQGKGSDVEVREKDGKEIRNKRTEDDGSDNIEDSEGQERDENEDGEDSECEVSDAGGESNNDSEEENSSGHDNDHDGDSNNSLKRKLSQRRNEAKKNRVGISDKKVNQFHVDGQDSSEAESSANESFDAHSKDENSEVGDDVKYESENSDANASDVGEVDDENASVGSEGDDSDENEVVGDSVDTYSEDTSDDEDDINPLVRAATRTVHSGHMHKGVRSDSESQDEDDDSMDSGTVKAKSAIKGKKVKNDRPKSKKTAIAQKSEMRREMVVKRFDLNSADTDIFTDSSTNTVPDILLEEPSSKSKMAKDPFFLGSEGDTDGESSTAEDSFTTSRKAHRDNDSEDDNPQEREQRKLEAGRQAVESTFLDSLDGASTMQTDCWRDKGFGGRGWNSGGERRGRGGFQGRGGRGDFQVRGRGDFQGRGRGSRGDFQGRGRGSRGDFQGRGRGNRGDFQGRGRGSRGDFQGRDRGGRFDQRGGFQGRGRSSGFQGQGRGRGWERSRGGSDSRNRGSRESYQSARPRQSDSGRGGSKTYPQNKRAAEPSGQEKVHPSWAASQKRKQQEQQTSFQGKRIKFDD